MSRDSTFSLTEDFTLPLTPQSRPEFYFLQQTFVFLSLACVASCYALQRLWLVDFPALKARERKRTLDLGQI